MDNMILGLLLFGSRTIYQLRERINQGLNLMYSSSMGSIQAAIKKLLSNGYIRCEGATGNRNRKFYTITDSGRAHFMEWVNAPMSVLNCRNPDLGKLYFMGFSQTGSRAEILESYLGQLEKQYAALDLICQEGETVPVPEAYRDIAFYQLASARYGRDLMQFNIAWYQQLLAEIRRRT